MQSRTYSMHTTPTDVGGLASILHRGGRLEVKTHSLMGRACLMHDNTMFLQLFVWALWPIRWTYTEDFGSPSQHSLSCMVSNPDGPYKINKNSHRINKLQCNKVLVSTKIPLILVKAHFNLIYVPCSKHRECLAIGCPQFKDVLLAQFESKIPIKICPKVSFYVDREILRNKVGDGMTEWVIYISLI